MSESVVRYTYRLRPGVGAERELVAEWDRCRAVWNQAVARLRDDGKFPGMNALTAWRKQNIWLREGAQVPQQQMLREFHKRRPKGKGKRSMKADKKTLPSLEYTRNGFSIREGRLRLPNKVTIPVVWSRELPSEPTSVRVYCDNLGHWYASFVVRREDVPLPAVDRSIGIDWGVSTIATTTSDDHDLPCPEFGKKSAAKLARYQRMMARRKPKPGQKASAGYRHAKRLAAKTHKKVARQREHVAREWAVRVVRDFDRIHVEDFKSGFLKKSTMARKAADNAVGMTKKTLVEYAVRGGRKVVLVAPAYTTMTCGGCGTRAKSRLLLSERVFTCESCGLVMGRDKNAAWVIHDTGELNRAGVEDVRHRILPSGEDSVRSEPEIPGL